MTRLNSIIVLFGPDGCGKSTHANFLASYLRKRGIKACISWVSSHHLLAHLVRTTFIALGAYVWEKDGTLNPVKNLSWEVVRTRMAKKIWLYIEFISIILVILFRVELPRILGKAIIVERYIPSSIADLTYMLGWPVLRTFPIRMLLKMARKNTVFVFLHCDWETHKSRRLGMTESHHYMKHQEQLYRAFSKQYANLIIDTSVISIAEAQRIIRKSILT